MEADELLTGNGRGRSGDVNETISVGFREWQCDSIEVVVQDINRTSSCTRGSPGTDDADACFEMWEGKSRPVCAEPSHAGDIPNDGSAVCGINPVHPCDPRPTAGGDRFEMPILLPDLSSTSCTAAQLSPQGRDLELFKFTRWTSVYFGLDLQV